MSRKYFVSCLLLIITACANARHIATPTSPPSDTALKGVNEDIEVKLHYIIVPEGPGSWVKGAKWNEWMISIRTLTQSDITIEKIDLIDPRGIYVGSQYDSVYHVEKESDSLAKIYKDIIVGSATETVAGHAIGWALSEVFWNFGGLIGGIAYNATNKLIELPNYLEAKDRQNIQAEYEKRRLKYSLTMSGDASIAGSAFFPLVPRPRALVVVYRNLKGEAQTKQIKLPLESLWNQSSEKPENK